MCKRWFDSFENFLEDMGRKPSKTHSIERVDNDGDYTPENCRWATPTIQNRNTRRTRWVTYKGETKSAAEWAEIKGINVGTFYTRLNNPQNTLEEVMETPTGMLKR